jgi:ATP-binding cassette subfamily B multidrug efflux pump
MTLTHKLYRLVPLGDLPTDPTPPNTLGRFMWYFIRQIWPVLAITSTLEAISAFVSALIPLHVGWLVGLIQHGNPAEVMHSWVLLSATVVLLVQVVDNALLNWVYDHVYNSQVGNMLRRQLHHYTLGHSLSYFNNDYAGRVANKVLESGPALRDVLRSALSAVWYAAFYAGSAIIILYKLGGLLALPALLWLVGYALVLRIFVPQVREKAMIHSNMHSTLVGRVVDTYTNILTLKLFARQSHEDQRGLTTLLEHSSTMRATDHSVWMMRSIIQCLNTCMLLATGALALYGWRHGTVSAALVATALPMVWQMGNMSNWIMHEVTGIFSNLGRVEECMETIAKPQEVLDHPDAVPLLVSKGDIRFENVTFHYGKGSGVMENLSLHIQAGQKVGLVGRSGAGKSTLVSLLLRSHDLEGGRILVDGQDVSGVTQNSLREQIAMVTQDSALLNRSIRENILIGRPGASQAAVEEAARRAHAHTFVIGLRDLKGTVGYEALAGERGVKLSGGQRQRIGIARVFLKDAPILLLDEATSALDSEAEEAIQENLAALMAGKTVIAIAHRLSTLQIMDRIVVMDQGQVVEDGTHAELLRQGGIYAKLWRKQSGGFIQDDAV